MNIKTATTDRLIARMSIVNQDADNVEAQGHPAFAKGMRAYAEQITAELRRRGYRI
jgi:hypothetical protein